MSPLTKLKNLMIELLGVLVVLDLLISIPFCVFFQLKKMSQYEYFDFPIYLLQYKKDLIKKFIKKTNELGKIYV